jgi:N6-adenosine-specific RNA methylase IME4
LGSVLRLAAELEPDVRNAIATQVAIGGTPNIRKAVKQVRAALGEGRDRRPDLKPAPGLGHHDDNNEPTTFPVIVIDPPWRYDNVATRGAAEDHYPTMSLDELAALQLPAAADAHIYLWVTNSFLRPGFDLLDAWGFTYKTTLTWCKPQIGMGNWFRNSTEHVLFGVKGRLPTQRNDVPTWFVADRTRHSAKPESFYDLVESCSPGPYFEMFARRRRFGWHVWGNEA